MTCELSDPRVNEYVEHTHIKLGSEDWNEAMDNGRLITAAPDLLAACQAFIEAWEKSLQLEKTDIALRMAKDAIEKAIR